MIWDMYAHVEIMKNERLRSVSIKMQCCHLADYNAETRKFEFFITYLKSHVPRCYIYLEHCPRGEAVITGHLRLSV